MLQLHHAPTALLRWLNPYWGGPFAKALKAAQRPVILSEATEICAGIRETTISCNSV